MFSLAPNSESYKYHTAYACLAPRVQKANCLSTSVPVVTRSYLKNRLFVLYVRTVSLQKPGSVCTYVQSHRDITKTAMLV
jgi:hypothetical protein